MNVTVAAEEAVPPVVMNSGRLVLLLRTSSKTRSITRPLEVRC